MKQIKKFASAFNAKTHQGTIVLAFDESGADKIVLSNLAPELFNAYLSILEKTPVYMDSNGWIRTDYEIAIDLQ